MMKVRVCEVVIREDRTLIFLVYHTLIQCLFGKISARPLILFSQSDTLNRKYMGDRGRLVWPRYLVIYRTRLSL